MKELRIFLILTKKIDILIDYLKNDAKIKCVNGYRLRRIIW